MSKSLIGLILTVIGAAIVLFGIGQATFSDVGSQQTCFLTASIGGIIAFIGIYILTMRLKGWSSR